MPIIEGNLSATGIKAAIVVSRFNHFITEKLVGGANDALIRHGASIEDITEIWVPGAFELPFVSKKAANSGNYDVVIALGAVIRGGTPHFDYVAGECTKGLGRLAYESEIPIVFGVITTNSIEQAIERAGTKSGNKGWDAGCTAIEMVSLVRNF
jgi:6,7-dimethyl-8-ribityllumazine synthase